MLPLLAQFTPIPPGTQLTMVSLLAAVLMVLNILQIVRRKPPLDTELAKIHGAVQSLQASVQKLDGTVGAHASHSSKIESLEKQVRDLELKRETDLAAQRKYTRETTHEIFEKIDGLRMSLNGNLQSVERAMGRIEGEVKHLSAAVGKG